MEIKILSACEACEEYLRQLDGGKAPSEGLWEECVTDKYLKILSCYAPFDMAERMPRPPANPHELKDFSRSLQALKALDYEKLQSTFDEIASRLPKDDEDDIYTLLFPSFDTKVREYQNGVIGSAFFGNILICIDSLGDCWEKWIPYVFAHEYHHSCWGNYWFVKNKESIPRDLLFELICEGQADCFALSYDDTLRPRWLFDIPPLALRELYQREYLPNLFRKDFDYNKFIFGKDGLPRCAGYAVGFMLVREYLKNNPLSFSRLLEKTPGEIFQGLSLTEGD